MADSIRAQIMSKVDTLLKSINTSTILFSGATGVSVAANGTYYQVSSILYRHAIDSAWTIKYTAGTTTWAVWKDDSVDPDTKVNHFTRVNAAIAGAYVATVNGEGITPLATAVTSGNYETNIGQRVYEWLSYPLDDDALPACSYKDTDAVEIFSTRQWKHNLAVDVLLFANTADTIRRTIADTTKAFGTSLAWGGLARTTEGPVEANGVEQKTRKILVASLTFTIVFYSNVFDPYT